MLKLLLMRIHERDHEFVTRSPSILRKRAVRIQVEFAREELSEFEVSVQIVIKPSGPSDHEPTTSKRTGCLSDREDLAAAVRGEDVVTPPRRSRRGRSGY